jgi:hypothetical protein
MLVEQRLGGDEKSRRAVTALSGAEIGERLLQRVQLAVGGEALDGRHASTVTVDSENEARQDRLAIEEHGAGAAFAQLAPVLGAA